MPDRCHGIASATLSAVTRLYSQRAVTPWTQRITLTWAPTVRYFEQRSEILSEFEQAGLVHGFEAAEDRVSLQLGDANHFLAFGADRLDAAVLQPDGDVDRMKTAVSTIIEALAPSRLGGSWFTFQWLIPQQPSYDDVRGVLAERLYGKLPGLTEVDTAVYFVAVGEDPPSRVLVEFGIVEAAEAAPRLAREIGSMMGFALDEAPATLWVEQPLPAVAFFADTVWYTEDVTDASGDVVVSAWEQTCLAAEAVVTNLISCTTNTQGDEVG